MHYFMKIFQKILMLFINFIKNSNSIENLLKNKGAGVIKFKHC